MYPIPASDFNPTPYPDVNAIVHDVLSNVQKILGGRLTGMYLDGSLASGDFDQDSDIDFVVVTQDEIDEETFQALKAMHERLALTDSIWAIQLEGSYISRRGVRQADPSLPLYPNIERGRGERLKLVGHGQTWDIHRSVLRERGITLVGPDPRTLIDPISPDQIRQAMRPMLEEWAGWILEDPKPLNYRGYQSYVVLTMCRILYTLAHGAIASKPAAARWAEENLDKKWGGLIERARDGRHNPDPDADPEDIDATLELVRFVMRYGF
jgi:hypothetical protein